jgi:hypothetical protein
MFFKRVGKRWPALLIVGLLALLFATATSALADERDFTLHNDSSVDIYYVYLSPSTSNFWGDDVLGEDVLPSGDQFDINFDDPRTTCVWDIKAVGHDGSEGYIYKVDLCSVADVYFRD